jgi:rsbT co-antagonist protein RsbR
MTSREATSLPELIAKREASLAAEWKDGLVGASAAGSGRIQEKEILQQCQGVLRALREGLADGETGSIQGRSYAPLRELLAEISDTRAQQGFSPGEIATFVFSLKQPLFAAVNAEHAKAPEKAAREIWSASLLVDKLGLHTLEHYQRSRDAIIARQREELTELSTPVVRLWDGILAVPLIGTLDSARTQVVMESLLQAIVDLSAEIAIIDITGVPTVDTLVAQHLLKTVAATRLMGADCIISGVRPQIAQTLVHLGVELNVTSKATLSDALRTALDRTGRRVVTQDAG